MSETVENNNGYPKKIRIIVDGREREVYDVNNLFPYISAMLRIREREQAGLGPNGLLEEMMQGSDLRPHFEAFIDGEDKLNKAVVHQAQVFNGFMARMHAPDRTPEEDATYVSWVSEIRDTDTFRLMMSDAFEAMAPMLEADGRQPVELTI